MRPIADTIVRSRLCGPGLFERLRKLQTRFEPSMKESPPKMTLLMGRRIGLVRAIKFPKLVLFNNSRISI